MRNTVTSNLSIWMDININNLKHTTMFGLKLNIIIILYSPAALFVFFNYEHELLLFTNNNLSTYKKINVNCFTLHDRK